jgi:hypothetical protein
VVRELGALGDLLRCGEDLDAHVLTGGSFGRALARGPVRALGLPRVVDPRKLRDG